LQKAESAWYAYSRSLTPENMKQKTKKSVVKRLTVSRNKKVRRRATSLGHSRANKSGQQLSRKKKNRGLTMLTQTVGKYI